MKVTYDPKYNISYIKLAESSEKVETIKISDEVNIDLSPDGKIYGIELLNANELMKQDGELVFLNEGTGEETKIAI
ncbi:MAG: DUF2283 domain-containing protein [Candidatus Acidulodesulfobacterium sp.]|uniref:DUF2283 domain-containing protein n=1 Tax=Acididesulfobacter guangdongensis TaxID=2597225 RepID=A0A519BHW6_ACIG2|nr:MAG: DUF2283 domain-containing protein [Candidatus Acididesulfobacter guangdongensis]